MSLQIFKLRDQQMISGLEYIEGRELQPSSLTEEEQREAYKLEVQDDTGITIVEEDPSKPEWFFPLVQFGMIALVLKNNRFLSPQIRKTLTETEVKARAVLLKYSKTLK